MSRFIDEVWTENPGIMMRVTDLGHKVLLEFVEVNGVSGNSLSYSVELTKYRWDRIAAGIAKGVEDGRKQRD